MLIFWPFTVKANIICNDGTTSPSCSTCHKGCCSKHGGCSTGNSTSNSTGSTNKNPTVIEKVKSSDNSLKKVVADGEEVLISDDMIYFTTKENVTVLVIPNDSNATVDYKKNPDLIIGENNISIKVTAENGSVKNYNLSITRGKLLSDNKNIKIFVDGKEVHFNLFKSDVIYISNDKDKIDITYELEDSKAKAEIIDNENLQVGYNEIIVKVQSENGDEQNYILVVQKEEIENKTEKDKVSIKEDVFNNYSSEEDDRNIFLSLGSFTLLGGAGYLIYKRFKNK